MSGSQKSSAGTSDFDIDDALATEERNGHLLAIKGRLYALMAIGILLLFVTPFPDVFYFHILLAVFAITGLLVKHCQDQHWFRPWHNYGFVLADFALLTFTVLYPNPFSTVDFPPQVIYRFGPAIYLFVLLIGLAFSYRPKLLLIGGLAGALTWGLALYIMLSLPDTVSSLNIDAADFQAAPLKYLLNPTYIDLGVRLQEGVVFIICATLIATMVLRSRRLVVRQIKAQQERHSVRESLGKYVPVSVVNAIVADQGSLTPRRHEATMLFADIEDFTGLVERTDPAQVFAILNEYFSAIGAAIVAQGGVINQFQGDAVLVTFNLPVEDPDHAAAAVRAARAIRETCERQTFAGQKIRTRIGIATGEVIAGSVGSSSQLAYTVHGDAVNLAARLEQMNKQTDTTILIAEATVTAAQEKLNAKHIGEIPIRGRTAANVYSV